ncbi:Hypothetical protein NTJ_08840 [Nesidiocoris tenuis]|uniref:Uncharacterized protein n=1 Tax=Nesidiocoris tenuis TaxID=355587 RepID=A0ABN7AYS3_9HEMI|nr:Hypothetical protein NTJ_08840 [Nesidiocoris tenuis]
MQGLPHKCHPSADAPIVCGYRSWPYCEEVVAPASSPVFGSTWAEMIYERNFKCHYEETSAGRLKNRKGGTF